jgi:hypothetical protein
MKITRKQLSDLIKKTLVLEGLKFDQFKDCALFISSKNDETKFLLFNTTLVDDLINLSNDPNIWTQQVDDIVMTTDLIYGMIVTRQNRFPCNAAYEVINSAAQEGWGPTLYDTVMGDYQFGIISDRGEVSPEAYNLYKYYYDNRTDKESEVEKLPLDNMLYRWTNAPYDDCQTGSRGIYSSDAYYQNPNHQTFLQDPLSWSYNRGPVPNRKELTINMTLVVDTLIQDTNFNQKQIEGIFRIMSQIFFIKMTDLEK